VQCDEPRKVGPDRLLNAVAAYARKRSELVVVDAGTAVTVDLVSRTGAFCGGAILPGPETMLRALHEHAELLPSVPFQEPATALGRNTPDAMRAGAYWGTVGAVGRLAAALAEGRPGRLPILVTGGYGEFLARELGGEVEFVPWLTLEGLALLVHRRG